MSDEPHYTPDQMRRAENDSWRKFAQALMDGEQNMQNTISNWLVSPSDIAAMLRQGADAVAMIVRLRGALDLCADPEDGWPEIECADAYEASKRVAP